MSKKAISLHVSKDDKPMGNYQGTGSPNKMGKVIRSAMTNSTPPKKLKTPPRKLA